jgi:hypothetical protein
MKIAAVSDVSVGYGSPQVIAFFNSLVSFYKRAEAVLFEPDQSGMRPLNSKAIPYKITRITSTFHPHTSEGRAEYIQKTTKELNNIQPDVLVIFCAYNLPLLFLLKQKPGKVIYYSYELTSAYGNFAVALGRNLSEMVDLVIFPEENRAIIELKQCGMQNIPVAILYNSASIDTIAEEIISAEERNGRILYAGTIDPDRTLARYYLSEKVSHFPIDMYGKVTPDEFQSSIGLNGDVRYLGFVEAAILAQIRKKYAFSIVMWNPVDDQHHYAAPNKFLSQ